jgi:hypothetical protein
VCHHRPSTLILVCVFCPGIKPPPNSSLCFISDFFSDSDKTLETLGGGLYSLSLSLSLRPSHLAFRSRMDSAKGWISFYDIAKKAQFLLKLKTQTLSLTLICKTLSLVLISAPGPPLCSVLHRQNIHSSKAVKSHPDTRWEQQGLWLSVNL